MPVATLARVGRDWFAGRLAPDWKPRTRDQNQAILTGVGLTDEFWQLP
jgi:hypothetical protein